MESVCKIPWHLYILKQSVLKGKDRGRRIRRIGGRMEYFADNKRRMKLLFSVEKPFSRFILP